MAAIILNGAEALDSEFEALLDRNSSEIDLSSQLPEGVYAFRVVPFASVSDIVRSVSYEDAQNKSQLLRQLRLRFQVINVYSLVDSTINAQTLIGRQHEETVAVGGSIRSAETFIYTLVGAALLGGATPNEAQAAMVAANAKFSQVVNELSNGEGGPVSFIATIKHRRSKKDDRVFAEISLNKGSIRPFTE